MQKTLLILLLIAVVVVALACKPSGKSDAYKTVGVDEFEQLAHQADSVVVLDVRTPQEFAEGHLRRAVAIDINDSSFLSTALERLPMEKTIAVYCRSGRRSAKAAALLAAKGYIVVNLDGGIIAWNKAGKETEGSGSSSGTKKE